MATSFYRMPSYEFGLQFWFQQNKLTTGQTILTWWTDSRGRELEIADTSNIFFYHMNNRSEPSGVGINDGNWHHVAFSWRLVCPSSVAIPGSTYCIEPRCSVPLDCTRIDITIIINGEFRGNSSLPPFIPSSNGTIIWGQRVLNYLSPETVFKNNLYDQLQASASKTTSNIEIEFTDRELQLIYNRIRSNYLNDSVIFPKKLRTDTTGWVLTEDEPWRDPYFKYCETLVGDFDPFASLSANIDEIRMYSYYRLPQDIAIAMSTTLSGDDFYTYSDPEANVSLILYHNFDLDSAGLAAQALDDVSSWPLSIVDLASPSLDWTQPPADSELGGGVFSSAPLQIPSTAPLRGSRSVHITIPDAQQPIPIRLVDLGFEDGKDPGQLYSRIDAAPLYGDLKASADDCDSITTVDFSLTNNSAVGYRSEPACLGGVLLVFLTGGVSNSTLTRNCRVGTNITASDGYGSGFLGVVSAVDSYGTIQAISVLKFGKDYDWINTSRTEIKMGDAGCLCGGAPGNVLGNMRPCLQAMVGTGKAVVSGKNFPGVDLSGTSVGYDYVSTSCHNGQCPAVKPRPCTLHCERTVGWMTDLTVKPTQYNKFMAGPYSQFAGGVLEYNTGFEPVYWSNSQHIVWYVPTTFGKNGQNVDSFLLRKFDDFPLLEIIAANLPVPPPYPHTWVRIVKERLALPLNSSIIWEENSHMVIQLQFVDFDRGTNVLNSPFKITIDAPSRGFLYQAIPINRSDPAFAKDCICRNAPRFPLLNRTPFNQYYPPGTSLPGSRYCNLDSEGNFCMKMGSQITLNDSLVTQFEDSINIPGFQHTFHGFHVIYYMGYQQYGSVTINWRMKHPQGQIQDANIDITVRNVNNPPVSLNVSYQAWENTVTEIQMQALDIDDYLLPTMYVNQYPKNGDLYECISEEDGLSPCRIGDPIDPYNDTFFQWATITDDAAGAVDDSYINVSVQVVPENIEIPDDVRVGSNASTILQSGYGYKSWDFNPDQYQNFKELCGGRGTVAARLSLASAAFVTDVEIFQQLRFDTPFRLLAQQPHPTNEITFDYGINAIDNHILSIVGSVENVSLFDVNIGTNGENEIDYVDQSKFESWEQSYERKLYCGISQPYHYDESGTICQSVWNNSTRVKGRLNTFSANRNMEWLEFYRGLPHQAQASKTRIAPIFSPLTFQTSELRVEACGQGGRIFDDQTVPFLESKLVRVTGTKTFRPAGFVLDRSYRVLYVPHPNWNGEDSFSFFVRDHAGGANRSSARFSMARGTSPVAHVAMSVRPLPSPPYGTSTTISSPPSDGISSVLISLAGSQAGPSGNSAPIQDFIVDIIDFPHEGRLLDVDGNLFAGGVARWVRFQAPANVCGRPFEGFRYSLRNSTSGENMSSIIYSISVEVRCAAGNICNLQKKRCEACQPGQSGRGSGIELTCYVCPPGEYQDHAGSTSCLTCYSGSFSASPGSTACSECPAGTISVQPSAQACKACPPGTFSTFPASTACHSCGAQAFTRTIGSITCSDCPLNSQTSSDTASSLKDCECVAGFYVLGSSGMACLPCPDGAYCAGRGLLPVPRSGYWTTQTLWTESMQILSGDGRWSPLNVSGNASFIPCTYRYIRGVCVGYPDINVQEQEQTCLYRNSIVDEGPKSFNIYTSLGISPVVKVCSLLWPGEVPIVSPPDALRPWINRQNYSADYYCAEGYSDFICSKCSPWYDRSLSSYCEQCPVFFQVPFIGLCYFLVVAGFNIIGWCCMFQAVAFRARSFHLIVTHLQLLAVFGRMAVPWPRLAQGFLNFCSWFNLNVDGMDWNCMFVDIESYTSRWYLDAAIPLTVIACGILYSSWSLRQAHATLRSAKHQVAERLRHSKTSKGRERNASAANVFRASIGRVADDQDSVAPKIENHSVTSIESSSFNTVDTQAVDNSSNSDSSSESASSAVGRGATHSRSKKLKDKQRDRDTIVPSTPKDIRKIQDDGIQFVLITLNILYVMSLITVFVPVSCSSVKADYSYLDWNPAFRCNTAEHSRLKLASFVLGVFWAIMFPSVVSYILWKAWQMELIRDKIFARRFGWLIEPYEIKYFWWEIAVIIRKTVIVTAQGVFTHNGYLQLLVVITYSCFHLTMTFYCRPHAHFRHTVIDVWLQIQFLLLSSYAFSNIIGQDGMRIVNIYFGLQNANDREIILPAYPNMDAIADRVVNSSVFSAFMYVLAMGFSVTVSIIMIGFDIYRIRPSAPAWAPFFYNAVTGLPLQRWNHDVSQFMALLDEFVRNIQHRKKVVPPERPPSRWAHRITELDSDVNMEKFWSSSSLKDIVNDVIAASQNEEWARNKESVVEYIRSIERRIFSAEMYYSASTNLPHLERERNNAKKVLMHFIERENEHVFQSLYTQTGRNEKLMWDILEAQRLEKIMQVQVVGKLEEKFYIEREYEEQQRRVVDARKWKIAYEREKKHCQVSPVLIYLAI